MDGKQVKRLKDLHVLGSAKSRLSGNSVSVHILTGRLLIPAPVFTQVSV